MVCVCVSVWRGGEVKSVGRGLNLWGEELTGKILKLIYQYFENYFENYFDSNFLHFCYFEPLFIFRSKGNNFGVMNNNLTLKLRAENESLIKSISSKKDGLPHFNVKRELKSILYLPALCYL